MLKEHGDKVSAEDKAEVQTALDDLKKVEKSENLDEVKPIGASPCITVRLEIAPQRL
jgi:hypothetical protein